MTLDLSNNQLDGAVPDSMADHPYLRLVDMRTNSLSGLPQAWTDGSQAPTNNPPLTNLLVSDNPLKVIFAFCILVSFEGFLVHAPVLGNEQ